MKLTKQEKEMLDNIMEGISDTYQLTGFMVLSLETVKEMLDKLEGLGLVKLTKKYDQHYKEDYWMAELTEEGEKVAKV